MGADLLSECGHTSNLSHNISTQSMPACRKAAFVCVQAVLSTDFAGVKPQQLWPGHHPRQSAETDRLEGP